MLVVGRERIERFLQNNAAARAPMERWNELTTAAQWHNILDIRRTFSHADAIRGTGLTCFNIGGNKYRLMTIVSYQQRIVSIVELLTHEEYDRRYA